MSCGRSRPRRRGTGRNALLGVTPRPRATAQGLDPTRVSPGLREAATARRPWGAGVRSLAWPLRLRFHDKQPPTACGICADGKGQVRPWVRGIRHFGRVPVDVQKGAQACTGSWGPADRSSGPLEPLHFGVLRVPEAVLAADHARGHSPLRVVLDTPLPGIDRNRTRTDCPLGIPDEFVPPGAWWPA